MTAQTIVHQGQSSRHLKAILGMTAATAVLLAASAFGLSRSGSNSTASVTVPSASSAQAGAAFVPGNGLAGLDQWYLLNYVSPATVAASEGVAPRGGLAELFAEIASGGIYVNAGADAMTCGSDALRKEC